jgi:hypothetical protein
MTAALRYDHDLEDFMPARPPRPLSPGGANHEARGPLFSGKAGGDLTWPVSYHLAAVRIGLTPRDIMVAQILCDLPREESLPGAVVWIAATTLAKWTYPELTDATRHAALNVLRKFVRKGWLTVYKPATTKQAAYYDLTPLLDLLRDTDVSDVHKPKEKKGTEQ